MLKQQIYKSYIYKFLSIIISFLIVRVNIDFLGVELFGVWAVLLTVIQWIVFFDFGIGNGLKNKVSEALSKNDIKLVRIYISSAYFGMGFLVSILGSFFFILNYFIDWNSILNSDYTDLALTVNIIIFFTLIHFVTSLINHIVIATHNSSISVFNQFLFQIINLVIIVSFMFFFENRDLYILAIVYGMSIILASIFISIYFFSKNKKLRPTCKRVDKRCIKPILSLGLKFFYLQLTILIIYTSDKLIISKLLGSASVAKYEILQKYFSVIIIFHTIINTPLWPFYKKCYIENNYIDIINVLKKMVLLFVLYVMVIGVMIYAGDFVISIWINEELDLNFSNYLWMGGLTLTLIWYTIFSYFSNGIDKTQLQAYTATIGAVINIPLSIIFINNFNMGINGVLLATIVSLSIFSFFGPLQAIYEINKMRKNNG